MLYNFYPNTNYDGISVTDILKRFKFSDEFLKSSFVENYTLKEEDSPESLAYLLYKDPKMSWLVLLLNNMSDRNTDWPYSYRNMERVLEKKYKGTSFFIQDEDLNFVLSDSSYISVLGEEYQIKSFDRTFNKITLEQPNSLLTSGDIVYIYKSNGDLLASPQIGRVVYDDKFSLHHFEVSGEYLDPRELNVEENSTYLRQYIEGFAEQYVVSNMVYELNKNDEKRNIILLVPEQLQNVLSFIKKVFDSSNKNLNIINIQDVD